MEIQHNFKSFAGPLLYILYSFLHFLYLKTWSLVQQYHKQSLMSQMEPLMTINYTCHAKVSRWYIGTFSFTRLTFKWTRSQSWINMIKRHWSYKRNFLHSKQSRKKITGLFGKGYLLIIHLFSFIWKKIGTIFAYFDNTAKSKAKIHQ